MNHLSRLRMRVRIVASLVLLLGMSGCGDGGGSANPPAVASYAVSGTISHLDSGSLSISDGGETLTLSQGATSFAFTKPLANAAAYTVTVTAQPPGESCVINNASGTINGAAAANVSIVCNTLVSQPLAVGVSAVNNTRIYLPVGQVGTTPTSLNVVLDTGSTGTLLRAADIFPSSMVTTNGFVFPAGQTSISYNGITVTNVVATRQYGEQSTNPTQETGNLGFAQVTFGIGSNVTTAMMPVLFVYQEQTNAGVAAPAKLGLGNLVGVNPNTAPIIVGGMTATSTTMPCTLQSTSTCSLASPFRYFTYANGVDKGFVLNKVTFASCAIETAGSCPSTPSLTIGVTANIAAGFSTTGLSSCRSVVLIGGSSEPACSQVIPSVIVWSGNASFTGSAIFDSGSPTTLFEVPAGMSFPDSLPAGSAVKVTTPSGFAYQYTVGAGFPTVIDQGAGVGSFTNSGISFFAQNSFLVDYNQAIEGWRNGS